MGSSCIGGGCTGTGRPSVTAAAPRGVSAMDASAAMRSQLIAILMMKLSS
jgi:hypothetical protein